MSEPARPILSALTGDPAIEALFTDEADIGAMLAFEAALAETEAEAGFVPPEAAAAIVTACKEFSPDWGQLAAGMAKDGVVVPALVAALRAALPEPHLEWLHYGATSQDAVDTSLVIRLTSAVAELGKRLDAIIVQLADLRAEQGATRLMAQTRMQRALPFTALDKIEDWMHPLERHSERLAQLKPRLLVVQIGGPVGNRDVFGDKGDEIAAALAVRLGLRPVTPWHNGRDGIAEFAGWLSMVTGALGKVGQDVALMAQNEIGAVKLASGGASSAMPHKNNPIGAEVLVALARFNAGLLGMLHQALIHENERSGAAWTLEWLVLPQMAVTAGAALAQAARLLDGLRFVAMAQ
jgi:3-carboxy-cis,cis-muconate cycloisomerase